MDPFVIFTDTGCDVSSEVLRSWNVQYLNLTFSFDDDPRALTCDDMPIKDFYQCMRDGRVSKTAAINTEDYKEAFAPVLQAGSDVLYLCFSSGLSTSYSCARAAAAELKEEYPDRRVLVVDSLAASAGHGLLTWYAKEARDAGKDLDGVAADLAEKVPHLCHWFTVDDLVYLKRGGRVSAATALLGGILDIKPVLHVDDEGHLISMAKVKGRRQSVKALFNAFEETAFDKEHSVYFISHGDCIEDALALEKMVFTKYGVKATLISDIGPVIGSHSGPGTLAFFFLGDRR